MDFWTFLGGLTMGAAAAAIYDMSSSPKLLGQPASGGTPAGQQDGTSFARSFGPSVEPSFVSPAFPGYYPPVAPSGRMTCVKVVDPNTEEETYECTPKSESAIVTYRYPTVFMKPLFF